MDQEFALPVGLLGRFAVVKLWPDIKAAEDECIARLKIAAAALGMECIEIHADGRLLEAPDRFITKKDVDFVLHLHYDTPKLYDVFSFVALWNPIQFYHEWGYSRTSRNLLTHDDFISCSSPAADDHVGRMVRRSATHLPPLFTMYHSVTDIVHAPSLGDHKLFYAGINWEALTGGKSRHQEVLHRLDRTGFLRIYGPKLFQGVEVWRGYKSYVREIPFDGVSMIDEIAKSGIALVLSSPAHKESELMSSRLFESVAAGALVICDENNFAKKYFGDSLLYIDTRCSIDGICEAIRKHLVWAEHNSDEALGMVAKAQDIFRKKFTLKKNLIDLYREFSERKRTLLKLQRSEGAARMSVCVNLLLPEYSRDILDAHIASVVVQEYDDFSPVLVVDAAAARENRSDIEVALANSAVHIDLLEVDFFSYGPTPEVKTRRRLGAIIAEVLRRNSPADAVVFVAPNEKIFSNHLQVLAGSLARQQDEKCVATAVILKNGTQPIHGICERIDFRQLDAASPMGYARFMFRVSMLVEDLHLALPYVDRKAMAVMAGGGTIVQEIPSTVVINIESEFPTGLWDEGQENELISSFCPEVFAISTGFEIILPPLSLPDMPEPSESLHVVQVLRWVVNQARALRRQGLAARIVALKRKLKKKLSLVKTAA